MLAHNNMSGGEAAKGETTMVSIPLSSDDENTSEPGASQHYASQGSSHKQGETSDNLDEAEEKARTITQVLELQNTLDDLSQRVDAVKDENLKLKSENQVLGQYIENLMSASSVFQPTQTGSKERSHSSKQSPKKGEKK